MCLLSGACACLRVLGGQARPEDQPCSSPQGSYFCNSTSACAAQLGAGSRQRRRVACIQAGYESVAHAALRYRNQLLGTIHLADRRPGRFPSETVDFLESVAPAVGEAIHSFRLEESLQRSEARFRSMFERHAAVMLLIEPESGALVAANPAAASFYGYPRERMRRMNIADLISRPSRALAEERKRAADEKRSFFTFPHRLATGEIRTVEVHSSPIEVDGQRLLFSIIHDITERLLLEKQVLDAAEKERQRVGQDLHDSLGSKLTGVALMSKALAQKLAGRPAAEAALAEEVVVCINELIGQTRAIAHGLCPVELEVAGLAGGLAGLAAETERRTGVVCRFQADPQVRLKDPFLTTHLFRIAQEAVNNAIRHGAARQVTIRLWERGGECRLEIRDDGAGLPAETETTWGLGLRTMQHRAGVIGAELAIASAAGGGTVVTCRLPRDHIADRSTAP